MRLFLLAGEPSGDMLGAALMRRLGALAPGVEFAGVGGTAMEREGLRSLFPLRDLAVMGLVGVLPHLPRILARMRACDAAIAAMRPDAVVTIDSPSFALRVAARAKRRGIPAIHYVAPQYWAWRPGRLKRLPAKIDRLLALFPQEPAFFAAGGVPTEYVGHPVLERPEPARDRAAFVARHGIAAGATLLAVLPGSRPFLARRMAPLFGRALEAVARTHAVHALVPVVETSRAAVAAALARWPCTATLVEGPAAAWAAFGVAEAALTVSGTVTLELAQAGVPMVVAYRGDEISARIMRRLARVRHAALPNLILERTLVPELLQWDCTPERIAAELTRLLDDPGAAAAQRAGFAELRDRLRVDGDPPSLRAARAVLAFAEARAAAPMDSPRTPPL